MDFMTEDGAERLATAIIGYWDHRGHLVNAWTTRSGLDPSQDKDTRGARMWGVRSDMINGMPRSMHTRYAGRNA